MMKLTVTTIPPVPVKPEKRYTLELSAEEATALLHLAICWRQATCSNDKAAQAIAIGLREALQEQQVSL